MNKHQLTHGNRYSAISQYSPPDMNRFKGAAEAARAWGKKHPNPFSVIKRKPKNENPQS